LEPGTARQERRERREALLASDIGHLFVRSAAAWSVP
jgi:hypothetical protein